MNSDKIALLKKIMEQKLSSFDFEGQINTHQEQLNKILETPADEFSFSGDIETGIENLVETTATSAHALAYLTSQKHAFDEILSLLNKDSKELNELLRPTPKENESPNFKEQLTKPKESSTPQKHFYDCKLIDEEWGSENCICPGAYVYRKYLAKGLTKEEAKLISQYSEFGGLMDEEVLNKARTLYKKHKFLKIDPVSK